MNTRHGGPLASAASPGMVFFYMAYTFLSVGILVIFAGGTGKAMLTTYVAAMNAFVVKGSLEVGAMF